MPGVDDVDGVVAAAGWCGGDLQRPDAGSCHVVGPQGRPERLSLLEAPARLRVERVVQLPAVRRRRSGSGSPKVRRVDAGLGPLPEKVVAGGVAAAA